MPRCARPNRTCRRAWAALRPAQTTGQWVAARFEHDSARPVDGYSAPQLHTHTVVFNMTTTEDGQTRALQPRELYRSQQYATAVYRSTLATQLRALGYEIERGGSGQPEIRGYTPEYLEASSPRRQQIETYLDETGQRGAAAAQIAAHQTRAAKADVPHHEMRRIHRDLAAAFDHQPARVVASATRPDPIEQTAADAARPPPCGNRPSPSRCTRNIERNAVPHERDYLRDALSRSMGHATVHDIHQEFERQVRAGQFVSVPQRAGTPGRAFTTPAMIALETQTIAAMREGKETQPALIREDTRLAIAREYPHLTADQRAAIDEIFANRDRVQALEGVAGAGKTTTLAAVRDVAERDGYAVEGLAPTGRAAQKLAEAGMPARTLQRHLTQQQPADGHSATLRARRIQPGEHDTDARVPHAPRAARSSAAGRRCPPAPGRRRRAAVRAAARGRHRRGAARRHQTATGSQIEGDRRTVGAR